jgi:hypothetical protein
MILELNSRVKFVGKQHAAFFAPRCFIQDACSQSLKLLNCSGVSNFAPRSI